MPLGALIVGDLSEPSAFFRAQILYQTRIVRFRLRLADSRLVPGISLQANEDADKYYSDFKPNSEPVLFFEMCANTSN